MARRTLDANGAQLGNYLETLVIWEGIALGLTPEPPRHLRKPHTKR